MPSRRFFAHGLNWGDKAIACFVAHHKPATFDEEEVEVGKGEGFLVFSLSVRQSAVNTIAAAPRLWTAGLVDCGLKTAD